MKVTSVFLSLATFGCAVAAQQHRHNHHHEHPKRAPGATQIVTVPGPTVTVYELDGKLVDMATACKGIDNGTYEWADGDSHTDVCPPKPSGGQFFEESQTSTSTSTDAPPTAPPTAPTNVPSHPHPPSHSGGTGVDSDFPDGELDCDTFPDQYGAVPLRYLGLKGWAGVQFVTIAGAAVSNIRTGIHGDTCAEGAMCSYACPPGYQKSQWPKAQGATGQSVGGIQCSGGKLHLTNPELSKKLCMPGAGNVKVQNTMSEMVAICRTDYPGTEAETIPVEVDPGATEDLTCPDASTYYFWQGKPTSAQYYVNNKGVSVEDACQWGDGSKPIGNWAPLNLGVGKKDGATWLAMFPNKPTTDADLDFTIEIRGDLSGTCKYSGGQFYSAAGANPNGCTVQLMSGVATFVMSN